MAATRPASKYVAATHILVFDAGTGIRPLGNTLATAAMPTDLDIFLSHCHIDHVIGLPFFAPLFAKEQRCSHMGRRSRAERRD